MNQTRKFEVERLARKSGGDRYQEVVPTGEQPMIGTLYVNQSVTRTAGMALQTLYVTISTDSKTTA